MDSLRTSVFVLFLLLDPVSCSEVFFTDPVICYFLDAFLMVYCIVATALFFREKFSHMPRVELMPKHQEKGGIYQELERPHDADPYQALELSKAKKKGEKRNRAKNQGPKRDKELYESIPIANLPASSPS
ncbi:T-cell surface glycoprotein CD3 zeta chain [Nothobranchius furzeri]|uniref:CD247 antigen like n=2 Tax=Nothobranchius furzeri TaxID=105023 RepID=A0A1A8B9V1_NOTFU|nr:CD247 antigen like isoform X2 [Nothobranchius furzeri]KAF7215596.1 CD247 molecule protein [Nothobranchius furzeri]